ncbi:MAG: hypothetical protein GY714_03865 [Desulfobacterales bacterium]|nr:hypothetical protein [Desulfobacterales bacterium]
MLDMKSKNQTKKCISCNKMLHFDLFHKNKAMKDGHINTCKSCISNTHKEKRKNDPNIKMKDKDHYAKYKDHYKDYRNNKSNKEKLTSD